MCHSGYIVTQMTHYPMSLRTLFFACVATALLGGTALAADSSSAPVRATKITTALKTPCMDKAPVVLRTVIPHYPFELRKVGIQGVVTVDLLIDSSGRVVTTELVSAPAPELGRLALAAAKGWTFLPASANGKPIASRVRVPFEFTMPDLVTMAAMEPR